MNDRGLNENESRQSNLTQEYPKVSIITVCFNAAKTIEQTIKSVLAQSYPSIEYIVIDGGSNDGTVEILRRYSDQIAYWISEPDQGMYDAMNKGIVASRGKYVGVLNSDDWLEIDAIKEVVLTFVQTGCDYTFGDIFLARPDGSRFGVMRALEPGRMNGTYRYKMPFPHQSCYVRREIINGIGFYGLEYRLSADHEFVVRQINSGAKGGKLCKPIASYRMGGAGGGFQTFSESRTIAIRYGMSWFNATRYYLCSLTSVFLIRILPNRLVRALLRLRGSRHVWY